MLGKQMLQSKPTFRKQSSPETWTPKRRRSEEFLLNRRLRLLIAPVNVRIPPWQSRVAFFRTRALWQGGRTVARGDLEALQLEVTDVAVQLQEELDEIPASRSNTRVVDTERALRSVLQSLDTLVATDAT